MRLRTNLAPLLLAVLLVTAGCAGTGTPTDTAATPATDADASADPAATTSGSSGDGSQVIEVGAAGRVETRPDRAVIRVAVAARGDDVSAVRRRLAENASSMRAALREVGVNASDVTTRSFDIGRNHRHEREPSEPTYRARHEFVVTIDDPDRAGEVIVVAIENGATEIEDVSFTITQQRRRELRQQALADAMANAEAQATTVAESANLTITGVHAVRTAEVDVRPFEREVAFAGAGDAGGTDVSGGPVTVTARVQVAYNATG